MDLNRTVLNTFIYLERPITYNISKLFRFTCVVRVIVAWRVNGFISVVAINVMGKERGN